MQPVRWMKSLQKFASVHANLHNHFDAERHLVDRQTFKLRHSAALAEWHSLVGMVVPSLELTSSGVADPAYKSV